MTLGSAPSRWLVFFAFLNIYIIWGSTYIAVAYGLKGFPPFILITLRYLIAGIILYLYCRAKQQPKPQTNSLWPSALSGTLMLVGGTGAIAWVEQYLTSGQTAILVATTPLWFLLLDRKNWHNYFKSHFTIAGLIVGFTGVYLFVKFGAEKTSHSGMGFIATLVTLLSCVFWVIGSLLSKRHKSEDSMPMTSSVQLIAAGAVSAIIALFTGQWQHFSISAVPAQAWAGLLFLITLGSLVTYLCYIWLLNNQPPALVSTHTYINPVVAVMLGWMLMHEQLAKGQFIGLTVILVGILLVNLPGYLKKS